MTETRTASSAVGSGRGGRMSRQRKRVRASSIARRGSGDGIALAGRHRAARLSAARVILAELLPSDRAATRRLPLQSSSMIQRMRTRHCILRFHKSRRPGQKPHGIARFASAPTKHLRPERVIKQIDRVPARWTEFPSIAAEEFDREAALRGVSVLLQVPFGDIGQHGQ